MSFTTHSYSVSFVMPAFLGNAEQQGQWRTPPFKALLRQWWRVANAHDCDYDVAKLAKAEGELFGVASDDKGGGSRRSRVQIRLHSWRKGAMTSVPQERTVQVGRQQLNPLGYLGYGVVDRQRVVHDFAIGPDEEAILELRFPPGQLETTLALLQWFGTLGGRSRNGWGSLQLEAQDDTPPLQPLSRGSLKVLGRVVRPWAECLMCEWPHAIGSDEEGPLVWVGSHRRTWQDALSDLAMAKKDFRGALPLDSRRTGLQRRHLLAYPVKEPIVRSWESEARLANQIRFKVKREEGGYRAIIAYVPCRLPGELYEKISDNEKRLVDQDSLLAWRTVIVSLNKQNAFRRIA